MCGIYEQNDLLRTTVDQMQIYLATRNIGRVVPVISVLSMGHMVMYSIIQTWKDRYMAFRLCKLFCVFPGLVISIWQTATDKVIHKIDAMCNVIHRTNPLDNVIV